MQGIKGIRREIDEVLSSFDGVEIKSQLELDQVNKKILDTLVSSFSQDIKIELDKHKSSITVNCFAYALNLGNSKNYKNLYQRCEKRLRKLGVPPSFISYLIEHQHLEEIESPLVGCLVLYLNQKNPTHAAILIENGDNDFDKKVRGRWGNLEALLEHRLWYVGENYGDSVKYYRPLSTQESEKYFSKFIEAHQNNMVSV